VSLSLAICSRISIDGLEVSKVLEISTARHEDGELLSGICASLDLCSQQTYFYEELECDDHEYLDPKIHRHVPIGGETTVYQDGTYRGNYHQHPELFRLPKCGD